MSAAAAPATVPTIFVVDDDHGVRQALSRLLRAEGWNVETFDAARPFLDSAPASGHGCVLLDVQMPGMSGPQAHAEMVARGMSWPVIFLTAHGDLPTGISAMKLGAVDFLPKPADAALLLQTLRQALEHNAGRLAAQARRHDAETRLARLSPREHEVLMLVICGLLNKQIADRMAISIKTVKVHRARVMEKLEVDSVAAVVHLCELAGLAPETPAR